MATRYGSRTGEHRRREPERRSEREHRPKRWSDTRQARLAELLAEQRQVVKPGRPRHIDTRERHADASQRQAVPSRKPDASSRYADDIAQWARRQEDARPAAHGGTRDILARAAVRNLVVAPADRWRGRTPEWVATRSRTADGHVDASVRTVRARAVRDINLGQQPTCRPAAGRRRRHVDSDANPRSDAEDHLRSGFGHDVDARRGELDVDVGTAVTVEHRHIERIGPAGRGRREVHRRSQRLGSARSAGAVLHDRRQRRRPRCGTSQRAPRWLTR
jgi:hypothetical protein